MLRLQSPVVACAGHDHVIRNADFEELHRDDDRHRGVFAAAPDILHVDLHRHAEHARKRVVVALPHAAPRIAERLQRRVDVARLEAGVLDREPRRLDLVPEQRIAGDAANRRYAKPGDRVSAA